MKKLILTGHIGRCRLEELEADTPPVTELSLCKYSIESKKRCSGDTSCGLKRFYERYPDYRQLGIGTSTEVMR